MCIGSGNIGEKYIHNELMRRGIEHAYLANSSTQMGWDIAVFQKVAEDNDLFKIKKIQVKTLNWGNKESKVITGKFGKENDFDYLCIVILNYSIDEPYITYLIPKKKLVLNKGKYVLFNNNTIQYTNKSITLNLLEDFKDEIANFF